MSDNCWPEREKRKIHKFQKRAGFSDKHHLKPKSKGGETISSNLIQLDAYRHDAWHLLFKDLTVSEVINLLQKVENIKEAQRLIFYLY